MDTVPPYDMRVAIVADTAYQVFNAVRLAKYNEELEEARVDLFIGHQFTDSVKIAERIRKLKLFDNVYDYYPRKNVSKFQRVVETIFPKHGVRSLMGKKVKNEDFFYDSIFLSLITEMSLCLILHNNRADVFFYDDGSGSYSRRMKPVSTVSKSHQVLYRILGRDLRKIKIRGLFLNNPSMYNSNDFSRDEICKIDPEGKCKSEFVHAVFDVGNTELYRQKKCIFLTDPDLPGDYEICNEINRRVNGILIRPHPRNLDYSLYEGKIDNGGGLWELLSFECISNDHILISGYSTAQLTPFIMFGKEPFLVFTYRLQLEHLSDELVNNIESMISLIKSRYSDKSKIIVINNYDELMAIDCLKV